MATSREELRTRLESARFGQVVVGPPGSGKTTYCSGMSRFAEAVGRKVAVINLDFANDGTPYTAAVDARSLVTIESAMEEYGLGPNGGLVFCMEALLSQIDWLVEQIVEVDANYFIFDCPGQVELYTHHDVVKKILELLEKRLNFKLTAVSLLDSFFCTQPSTFVSAALLVTSTMLRLGLPQVNVLTKVDLLKHYGELPFSLDFFTEMLDLTPLLRYLHGDFSKATPIAEVRDGSREDEGSDTEDQPATISGRTVLQQKFYNLTAAICEVVNDFGLVSYHPMDVQNPDTVARVLAAIDQANGYSMTMHYVKSLQKDPSNPNTSSTSVENSDPTPREIYQYAAEHPESIYSLSLDIQERYGRS